MEGCDLSFERSEVVATVNGHIDSVKNPISGSVTADSIGEIILEEAIVVPGKCKITQRLQNSLGSARCREIEKIFKNLYFLLKYY